MQRRARTAQNESSPRDALTTPDRPRVPVVARVVWARAGEESIEGYAMRWSGRSVFVTPRAARCRNGTLVLEGINDDGRFNDTIDGLWAQFNAAVEGRDAW